jgi:hypothetical protein
MVDEKYQLPGIDPLHVIRWSYEGKEMGVPGIISINKK